MPVGEPGYDIIPVFGQSNSAGAGTGYDTVRFDVQDSRVDAFPSGGAYARQIVRAGEPMSQYAQDASIATAPPGMSFALPFARQYAATLPYARKVLLVPCGFGGTGLSTPDSRGGTRNWAATTTGSDSLLNATIAAVAAAVAAAGPGVRIPFALWHQGEQDASNGRTTAQYAADFDAMLAKFRAAVSPDLPMVVGRFTAEQRAFGSSQVIDAAVLDAPRRNLRVSVAAAVPSGNSDPLNGAVHFSAGGQRILAKNYFAALPVAFANVLHEAPVTPGSVSLTQAGTTLTAEWATPLCRATDFNVRYSTDGGSTWASLTRAQSVAPVATLTGQTLGQTVQVQVRTVNEEGVSAWSASATVTLKRTPNAPTGLNAGSATGNVQPLAWAAPATDSNHDAATSYRIEYKKPVDATWTQGPVITGTTGTVTVPEFVTEYQYRIVALNAGGASAASNTVTATTGMVADMRSGLLREYSAASVTGVSDGGVVTSVPDSSGFSGPDVTQATAGARPTLKLNAANGQPALVFDGVNDFLADSSSPYATTGAETVVAIVKHTGGTLSSGEAVPVIGSGQNPR
ncbi:MAG: hypothetical protein NT132_04175 [Microbacterium sp.]|uniref:sialate O-acetylesterase n=1 Tax=Microbacterium sp. TaxID=51671 RepID=UPI00261E329F|nr:sialate O-acetylesterase [Microbacterium sp.]MCX6501595.1 hypothetical protein [Microbacterium sp.]